MPRPKPSRRRSNRARTLLLASAAILVAAVLAIYLITRTPSESETTYDTPLLSHHLYSETADPNAEIASALSRARQDHKHVLVDFGGDWCGDCQLLDLYLHQPPNAQLLAQNYLLVHVWIGHMDANLDVPARYGIPINKGVPALAVLDSSGTVLYAQQSGEFEHMNVVDPSSVTNFLEKWKS